MQYVRFNQSWGSNSMQYQPSLNYHQQHYGAKFYGMNLGDIMKITVREEMSKLKMSKEKPLDLTVKNCTHIKQV